MPHLEIYWSFRSPYSYLALPKLSEIIARKDVSHAMRFVRPLALREDDFFSGARPQMLPYLINDCFREAQMLGMTMVMPQPDPITMDMQTGIVEENQPHLERLMRIGLAADITHGKGFQVANAIALYIWGGTQNWHEGNHLTEAVSKAGLSLDALETWAGENSSLIEKTLSKNEEDQLVHHWGVPLMVLDGEPFFGQDRLATLQWRLDTISK